MEYSASGSNPSRNHSLDVEDVVTPHPPAPSPMRRVVLKSKPILQIPSGIPRTTPQSTALTAPPLHPPPSSCWCGGFSALAVRSREDRFPAFFPPSISFPLVPTPRPSFCLSSSSSLLSPPPPSLLPHFLFLPLPSPFSSFRWKKIGPAGSNRTQPHQRRPVFFCGQPLRTDRVALTNGCRSSPSGCVRAPSRHMRRHR